MRRLALTTALLLLPHALTPARHSAIARAAQQCPAVVVSCPDSIRPGEEATFKVSVDAAAADVKYTYNWNVSAGTIAGGQGTPSIRVDTTGISAPVTGTVEVGGLPASCERYASCAAVPEVFRCGRAFDEYGDIPFEDEQARLDNIAIELQNDPTASGYLICYGGRAGYEGEAQRRCERAREYISKVRGVAPERLVTVDGGFREDLAVFMWVVPPGATPPSPIPTVDRSEVKIIKPGAAHKPRGH
jgi:hypothetical protein